MITGTDFNHVMTAMVPLYMAMVLAYGSVRWWKILTPDQCSGINRFVALFAAPLLSFHFIASNDPYAMNFRFLAADTLQKLVVLAALFLRSALTRRGSLDWTITLFSLCTLPNTLVMGIQLLKGMYGGFSGSLMVQIVVLQCIIWYTLMLFMFEYRRRSAQILTSEQFPGAAPGSTVSIRGDGKVHVTARRSNASRSDIYCGATGATPRPSNLTNAEIYSLQSSRNPTPRGSSYNHTDQFYSSQGPTLRPSYYDEEINNPRLHKRAGSAARRDLHMFVWSNTASPVSDVFGNPRNYFSGYFKHSGNYTSPVFTRMLLFTMTVAALAARASSLGTPPMFPLKREPRAPDHALLASSTVWGFELNGSVARVLYSTTLRLGSPPKEFRVQVDTGSDLLWVGCDQCVNCPSDQPLHTRYDFHSSDTGAPVGCSDERCTSSRSRCSDSDQVCTFSMGYADGSATSGYYVSEPLDLGSSARPQIVFGCSTEAANFTASSSLIDGLLGLGPSDLSIVAQLSAQSVAPRAFSHCLRSDTAGGGVLAFGAATDPTVAYTPLVPSRPHYSVYLRSISVSGQLLPLDPSFFESSNGQGTIIDSGTTLLLIADEGYNILIEYITAAVSSVASPVGSSTPVQCYSSLSSYSAHEFPQIRLDFIGGAFMLLGPRDYVDERSSSDGITTWCLLIGKSPVPGLTILGDVVLRDKIVVYDLASERIGWVEHDCSFPFNVSTTVDGSSGGTNLSGALLSSVFIIWVFWAHVLFI